MYFLFYSLISEHSENKNKFLKMRGHYIHIKPLEIVNSELQRYLIDKNELLNEQRFITKKFPSEIPLFFRIEVPNDVVFIKSQCPKCKMEISAPDHLSLQKAKCNKCKNEFIISEFDQNKFNSFKSESFLKSESFFKSKFEIMTDNYQMCS